MIQYDAISRNMSHDVSYTLYINNQFEQGETKYEQNFLLFVVSSKT